MPSHSQRGIPFSIHRAFIYSACAPGAGDIYAGKRLKGYVILVLFIVFSSWMIVEFARMTSASVTYLFGSLDTATAPSLPQLSVKSISVAFFGMLLIWYGGLLSAVESAVPQLEERGLPPQTSVAWALGMSWLCPGAGQAYTGQRQLGWVLLSGFIISILLMIPAYKTLFDQLSGLLSAGQLDMGHIEETMHRVHNYLRMVDFSTGSLLKHGVKWYAIAAAMASLREGALQHDTRWSTRAPGYALALVGIGWLCPGAGQLLQGRRQIGWLFLAGYIFLFFIIGLLAKSNVFTIEKAETLAWLHIILQWIAALEAPMAMRKLKS